MVAGLEQAGRRSVGQHGANRHARGESLGQRHHVRRDAGPLVGEPAAAAPHAALNLVQHHQPAVLVAQPPHALQECRRGGRDAAFALNGLQQHGGNARGGAVLSGQRFESCQIIEGQAREAGHQRLEAFLDLGVRRGRQCGHRTPVEGMLEHYHPGLGDASGMAVQAGQLERCLVGFQAGVAEEGVGHA